MPPSEHAPEGQSSMRLPVPVPPNLAETFGYEGDSRFVAFRRETAGNDVYYDDGCSRGTGEWYPFNFYCRHPAVMVHVHQYHLDSFDEEATHVLVLDRELAIAYIASRAEAQTFLEQQHLPAPELTSHEAEIRRRMAEQCRRFTEMLEYLDRSIENQGE